MASGSRRSQCFEGPEIELGLLFPVPQCAGDDDVRVLARRGVGAAESKEALIADSRGIPFIAVRGRRGGSAMASAAVNALAGGLGAND